MRLRIREGQEPVALEKISGRAAGPVHVVSSHKAGSTLLTKMMRTFLERRKLKAVAIEPALYHAGIRLEEVPDEALERLAGFDGVVFGYRAPEFARRIIERTGGRLIILGRDPRDIVTSFYFSVLYSHVPPANNEDAARAFEARRQAVQEKTISDLIREGAMNRPLQNIEDLAEMAMAAGPEDRVFRYENEIFAKARWMMSIAAVLGEELSLAEAHEIIDPLDQVPDQERPKAHVRQVVPGNYKKHLAQDDLDVIARRAPKAMAYFAQ